jgi:hypothetical protein
MQRGFLILTLGMVLAWSPSLTASPTRGERLTRGILTPARSVKLPGLKNVRPVTGGRRDQPWETSGTRSTIFRVTADDAAGRREVALKVFFTGEKSRAARYASVMTRLAKR